ncbi:MAG TPA: carboxypeptidase-like regulatory domain-containing protein [Candidatus Acidoferrales bacterium]|nr:carboxypeptidase-like regulatory domain-containing protein [Candidatus Acidoferrales bacterium]
MRILVVHSTRNLKIWCLWLGILAFACCFLLPGSTAAQATISTGSIAGLITDPTGAVVPGAQVTIVNKGTGQAFKVQTTSTGNFSSGALIPGDYMVQVAAKGFKTGQTTLAVQVGTTSTANFKLEIGSTATVVEVVGGTVAVNTEQAAVQDVLTRQDIENLPVNGRNFLDLATIEPGVQIQDGATFDPTKNGYSSLSFGGRAGRTARIEVDGLDISDETVGTTTQNIPQSSIQEFQVSQSTLDLSTELTSSGTVSAVTRAGSNAFHGDGYYFGRSDQMSARIAPTPLAFGRKQYGADLGGPLVKNKLFFFGDFERTDQSLQSPVVEAPPFDSLTGSFNSPFHEREYLGRLDYNIKTGWKFFARFNYDQNLSVRGFNPGVYEPFANVDHVRTFALGTDFNTGRFTHSIRWGYLKFHNSIADAASPGAGAVSPIDNPAPNLTLIIANTLDFTCLAGGENFCSGPNILAPQGTFQSDKQLKYDGSVVFRSHVLRYGVGYNKILGGGFASFFGIGPAVGSILDSSSEAFAAGGTFTCPNGSTGAGCPLNYPVQNVLMGNGQGFFTEIPQFGLPAGGQFDSRVEFYIGDSWRPVSRLTITYGMRYNRDTGRADSDLAGIPDLAQFNNQFYHGLQSRINQPNHNFGPQLGIAWDPTGSGKTVIRAGAGIYYENAIFNNVLFDRPARLQKGLFFGTGLACIFGSAVPVPVPGGGSLTPNFCGQSIGAAANQIAAFQKAFQKAVVAAGPQANGAFVGNTLAEGVDATGDQLIGPDYRSPYSVQINAGIQHQFGRGTVLTVDYLRNVSTHYLLGIDTNRVGDARFLDKAAAIGAIDATNASFGCGPGGPGIDCAIAAGASISDFAGNGLESGKQFAAGFPCAGTCAFPGINTNVGENEMLFPIGRSVYNGMDVSLKSRLDHPLPGMRSLSLIASYSLSRFDSQAGDQDFINNAVDFNNPGKFFGPAALDRTHQLGVGGVMTLPLGTQLSVESHWATAGAATLVLPNSGNPGEIFRTDVTGDGTVGDVLPGTNIGSFGRTVKVSDLNKVISQWNSTGAGKLTPAGQALVSAGLFTQAQLVQLGAVTPTLQLAPAGQVGLSPGFSTDAHLRWLIRPSKLWPNVSESFLIEPEIALFNVFNFQNFDPGGNTLSGVLSGTPGTANGTTRGLRTNLVSPGSSSGVNWYGVPRQFELGLKFTF